MSLSTRALSSSIRSANGTTQAGKGALLRDTTSPRTGHMVCCTHPVVERLYGPYPCDWCHKASPLGWVYVCTEDLCNDSKPSPVDSVFANVRAAEKRNVQSSLRTLGFSQSILEQAEAGVYTPEQIEVLKKQKLKVQAVIAAEQSTPPTGSAATPTHVSFADPPRSHDSPSTRENFDSDKTAPPQTSRPKPCHFKACHRCRPFLCDRSWSSFEAVYNGEVRPLTLTDRFNLPVKDASVVRTIGLCSNPGSPARGVNDAQLHRRSSRHKLPSSEDSPVSVTSSSSMISDEDSDWENEFDAQHYSNGNGTTFVYSAGPTESKRTPTKSVPGYGKPTLRHVSGSVSDGISLSTASDTPRTTTTARTSPMPNEEEFDLSLVERPTSGYSVYTAYHAAPSNNLAHVVHQKPSSASLVSGMEVEGGVALTEEAVRTHTPDILTNI
ncbi:hypothetical protein MBLNU459_g8180t1 [Dothideomycetes sp. NU459]